MKYSDKIINAFQDECTDLITSLEEVILLLEKEPDNKEHINEIFRLTHSIKSETGLMGFNNFSTLAHRLEDIFQDVREDKIKTDDRLIELSLGVIDKFKKLLNSVITASHDNYDTSDILNSLAVYIKEPKIVKEKKSYDKITLSKEEIKNYKTKGYKNIYLISIKLFENIALKYARAFLIYNNLLSVGDVIKSTVDFQEAGNDEHFAQFTVIVLTNKIEKEIYDLIDVSEVEKISIKKIKDEEMKEKEPPPKTEKIIANSIRVDVNKIEDVMNSVGELLVNHNSMEKFYETLSGKKFLFSKYDKSKFLDIISQFKRVIDMLQDNVMKFRMVPIKTLFNKFPHLIRTISGELNKKVNLTISGEYTEVDKTVIEEIREPLTHIIRNAIDHGLESKETRIKKGKPAIGTIKISSYQTGNNIIIEIADDGGGISPENIRGTILEESILSPEKLSKLNDSQILRFIFHPGFSTSHKITKLSGRGVGLDVVKSNIEKIHGKILIKTKKNKGTSFIISIPLSISITKALIIKSSNLFFAIPLYSIRETLRIYKNEIRIVDQYQVITLRKKLLSLLHLNTIFQLKESTPIIDENNEDILLDNKRRKKDRLFVVIVNYGNRNIGLIVDKLITEQDIVIKPLSEYVEKVKGVSGVAILGDGNVAYILEPINLIDDYLSKEKTGVSTL